MMETGPVFIGGLDRSGKTTLRAFLQSHPNLSIPAVGSNFWTYFYNQFGSLENPRNFERCLEAMLHYKQVRFLQPDPERIRTAFLQGAPSYARLFALFQQQHAEREGKPRWGDQTGLIERYADPVFRAYPDAKMIHMIRDPRDRYAGSLALWPTGKGRAGGAAARWWYSTQLAYRNQRKYPGRYLTVRFESMVNQPEETLRAVCAFLNEDFFPSMLQMPGAPEHREKLILRSHGDLSGNPLSADYIGIYEKQIDKHEIAFLQWVLGKRMAVFGYPPARISFTPAERAIFLFKTIPLNVARMIMWLLLETLQHHLPALFGRKPGRNMLAGHSKQPSPRRSHPAGERRG